MAQKYQIQAPDGKTYTVDGPEGATDEQVRAEVLRQFPQAAGLDNQGGDVSVGPDGKMVVDVVGGHMPAPGEQGYDDYLKAGYQTDAQGNIVPKAPDQRPTSQTQGFAEGFEKPLNNAADWLTQGLNKTIPSAHDVSTGSFDLSMLADPSALIKGALGSLSYAGAALEGNGNLQAGDAINKFGADTLGMAPSVQAARDTQQQSRDQSPYQSGGLGKFAGEVTGAALLSRLPGGAFSQGAQGGALLTDTPNDALGVARDAAFGGVAGHAGSNFLRNVGGLIAPRVSPDVRALIDAGIRPTSGQIAGAANGDVPAGAMGRTFKKVEDVVSSVPIAGAAVKNAQYRGVLDLNRSVANRALGYIGDRLPEAVPTGHDSIRFVGDRLSQAYNEVLPRLNGSADRAFTTRVRTLVQRADLPEQYDDQVRNTINEALKAFRPRNAPTGTVTPVTYEQIAILPPALWEFNGRRLRDASERLGDLASGWRRSDDPYMRNMADVAGGIRDQLHALARRQNPEAADTLRNIDRGYATLVRAERAASGTADGIFSPRQYDSAVRGMDGSARRRQSARGRALDQDLSGAASRVMANTAAMGGSKDVNSLIALGVLGTRAVGGDPLAMGGLGAVVGGSAAYSQPGQAALRAIMTRQPGSTSQNTTRLLQYGARAVPYAAPPLISQER